MFIQIPFLGPPAEVQITNDVFIPYAQDDHSASLPQGKTHSYQIHHLLTFSHCETSKDAPGFFVWNHQFKMAVDL